MIYLCTIKITGGECIYFYQDNYIYAIVIVTIDKSFKCAKQAVDISNNTVIPNTHEWISESQFPAYTIPNNEIYVDDKDGLFNILEKMIFEKL
jgi:hypothetical protein